MKVLLIGQIQMDVGVVRHCKENSWTKPLIYLSKTVSTREDSWGYLPANRSWKETRLRLQS